MSDTSNPPSPTSSMHSLEAFSRSSTPSSDNSSMPGLEVPSRSPTPSEVSSTRSSTPTPPVHPAWLRRTIPDDPELDTVPKIVKPAHKLFTGERGAYLRENLPKYAFHEQHGYTTRKAIETEIIKGYIERWPEDYQFVDHYQAHRYAGERRSLKRICISIPSRIKAWLNNKSRGLLRQTDAQVFAVA